MFIDKFWKNVGIYNHILVSSDISQDCLIAFSKLVKFASVLSTQALFYDYFLHIYLTFFVYFLLKV